MAHYFCFLIYLKICLAHVTFSSAWFNKQPCWSKESRMPPPRTSPGIPISQRWFYTSYSTWERLEQRPWRVLLLALLSPLSLPLNSFLWLWCSLYKKGPRVPDRLNAARAQKTTLSASWSLSSVSCFTKIRLLSIYIFLMQNSWTRHCQSKLQRQVTWSLFVPYVETYRRAKRITANSCWCYRAVQRWLMRYYSFKSIVHNLNHFLSAIFFRYPMATRCATKMSAPSKSDKAALWCVLFAASVCTCCYRCWWYSPDNARHERGCTWSAVECK